MISYAGVDGMPVTGDEHLLQKLLRESIGFDGVIISDAFSIGWLYQHHMVAISLNQSAS